MGNNGMKSHARVVVIGGVFMSLTGISLMFPFAFAIFGKIFAALNVIGLGLPADLSVVEIQNVVSPQ